jgi:hypothetical protein
MLPSLPSRRFATSSTACGSIGDCTHSMSGGPLVDTSSSATYGITDELRQDRYGVLDMWLGKEVWPQLRETMVALRKIQPDVMFRARGIGNHGDYYTPEGFVPGGKGNTGIPWFVIYPLG